MVNPLHYGKELVALALLTDPRDFAYGERNKFAWYALGSGLVGAVLSTLLLIAVSMAGSGSSPNLTAVKWYGAAVGVWLVLTYSIGLKYFYMLIQANTDPDGNP